jgi:hypothetical protein
MVGRDRVFTLDMIEGIAKTFLRTANRCPNATIGETSSRILNELLMDIIESGNCSSNIQDISPFEPSNSVLEAGVRLAQLEKEYLQYTNSLV